MVSTSSEVALRGSCLYHWSVNVRWNRGVYVITCNSNSKLNKEFVLHFGLVDDGRELLLTKGRTGTASARLVFAVFAD